MHTPSSKSDRALGWICSGLVAFGVLLRAQHLRFPNRLTFDEAHFVDNARNYLTGAADWNDHPPLGKLLLEGLDVQQRWKHKLGRLAAQGDVVQERLLGCA